MICNNCKANLSCSCKLRTASNGVSVCSACVAAYELKLQQEKVKES